MWQSSGRAAHCERPGDLTDIDRALGVHGDTVRRGKTTGGRGIGRAPAGQHVAVRVIDTHAGVACLRDGAKALRGVTWMPPEFTHVGSSLLIKDDVRRPLGICPLTQVFTIRAKDLDTVTLSVTDEDAPIRRHGNTVW